MNISGIDYLGLDRVLRRGSGDIIAEQNDALLIRDRISGALLLACEDAAAGIPLLDRCKGEDFRLLMVSDYPTGSTAFERYGFSEKLECFQFAYYGKKPRATSGLTFRTADMNDFALITDYYQLIRPEELEKVIKRQSVLLGYDQDRLVGFVGEHLEGSMGLLYVLPEFRRRGFGAALETQLIAKTMDKGYIPFGQVEKGNSASMKLQKKIGMTQSDHMIVWMWK